VARDRGGRDVAEELQHYAHADEDYGFLASLGIATAREGIPWPFVDKGEGEYDFSRIDPFVDAQRRHDVAGSTPKQREWHIYGSEFPQS